MHSNDAEMTYCTCLCALLSCRSTTQIAGRISQMRSRTCASLYRPFNKGERSVKNINEVPAGYNALFRSCRSTSTQTNYYTRQCARAVCKSTLRKIANNRWGRTSAVRKSLKFASARLIWDKVQAKIHECCQNPILRA